MKCAVEPLSSTSHRQEFQAPKVGKMTSHELQPTMKDTMAEKNDSKDTSPKTAATKAAAPKDAPEPAKLSTDEKKLKAFRQVLKETNKMKRFSEEEDGDNIISLLSEKSRNVETISTGSVVLDSILGGGMARGRVIEMFGPEASGKTSVALTAIGNVQRAGGTAAFIDLEHALDPKYAKTLGVDVDNLAVAQPGPAEVALDLLTELVTSGVVDIVVVDSIGAMSPRKELEGSAEDNSMAAVARLMSQHLRGIISKASKTQTTVIFINQLREKVGFVLGSPEVTMGGKAMKFFASQRIDIRKREKITEGKEIIGHRVKLKIVKNKVAPPYGEGETVLTFGKGINRAAEVIETAPGWGVIDKPSKIRYEFEGEHIGNGKAKAVAALERNPEMLEKIATRLAEVISSGESLLKEEPEADDDDDSEDDDE